MGLNFKFDKKMKKWIIPIFPLFMIGCSSIQKQETCDKHNNVE